MKLFGVEIATEEVVGVSIMICLAIYLSLKQRKIDEGIKRNEVYVIGKLINSEFAGDAGWSHNYEYKYKGQKYKTFHYAKPRVIRTDSLIAFRLDSMLPKNVKIVSHKALPVCIRFTDMGKHWTGFPACIASVNDNKL